MKVYFDNCCYNRPFDDPKVIDIRREIESIISIQNHIKDNHIDLVWSHVNDDENDANPFKDRRESVVIWKYFAVEICKLNEDILQMAIELSEKHKLHSKDALHIAPSIFLVVIVLSLLIRRF
ncbi:MAG: hypothetical protein LBU65_16160 [Planctomycetaceae bacterium]|jgi:predicted nucleic acid-binding protein|nr:hypothetical protein [Planctomycetaceae bacterium]